MAVVAELKTEEGEKIAVFPLPPKEFKTGSRGFYANAKAEFGGKRYQVQIQLVEIGSKKTESTEE
jgi:predicted RNA-binding protein with EMAP domain